MTYSVGFIGVGRPWKTEGATGFGMAYAHAKGYLASPDAKIVALADLVEDNAKAFQEKNGGDRIYADYNEMLAQEDLDIVSVCTWPHLHAQMVIDCANAGVKAIHCEKPMAPTYGEAKRMVQACEASGVQLTFNHQRRFGAPYQMARELARSGAIGDLVRLEGTCPDLFDWGTHWFDMMFFYNGETPADWVIGQVDILAHRVVFGVTLEGQGLSHVRFANGVEGILMTKSKDLPLTNRLYGTDGMIEVIGNRDDPVRLWNNEAIGWQTVKVEGGMHGGEMVVSGVLDLIDSLKVGREPELSSQKVMRTTEVIFATYESSRRRARVDLPLDIEDSPLHAMIESGDLVVEEG